MNNKDFLERGQEVVMNTYGRLPLALVKGEGAYVWDADGNKYLDFVSGLAVTSLGHNHPKVTAALKAQAETLLHTSNFYWIPNQVELAERLVENSFADKVFFCNSGAEANEAAIKLARKYAKTNGNEEKIEIITLKHSFHGRTMAALAATGQRKYQVGFEPLPPGFLYTEINDIEGLREVVSPKTAAILIEPIQGEGGVNPVSEDFLKEARILCDQFGALLIFDEVQCGIGRTGKLFAYEWGEVVPDVMTLAKALANGVPIGAMLAKDHVAAAFKPGDHASTFGGNPLATAAGCAVLEVLLEEGFLEGVQKTAGYFREGLEALAAKYGTGGQVRGQGMILGMPVSKLGPEIVGEARKRGLLINCVGGTTLRFLPPLIIEKQEIDEAMSILDEVFTDLW